MSVSHHPRVVSLRRVALIAASLCASPLACRGSSPAEPAQSSSSNAGAQPVSPRAPERYRPPTAESARRLATNVTDAGVAPTPTRLFRFDDLPLPESVDVIAAEVAGRWVVGAIERDRVTAGMAGAERIFELLNAQNRSLTAVELARIVGAFLYFPWRVYDGTSWSRTPENVPEPRGASRPMLTPRPRGTGRQLTFSYWIPDGTPGAGEHLASIHVTDSGLLIDEAPHPERR